MGNTQYKHARNSYAFHEMTNDAAYWLGFLYTDGCVTDDYSIQFKLKDIEPIQDFKKFLQYDGPIQTVTLRSGAKIYTSYQVSFYDKTLVGKLIELGCVPKKTYTLKYPTKEQLSDAYYNDFIRGAFDGDGSIFRSGNKIMMDITGTEDFLVGIRDVLVDNIVIPQKRSYIYKSHAKNPMIKRISLAKRESIENFYDFIYDNNPQYYLKRKKDKFEDLLNTT